MSAPLLHNAMHCPALKSWPNLPHRVKRSWFTTIWSLAVDITLLAWSVAFLALALIVNYYDEAPVAEHKTATDRLISASKYVWSASVRTNTVLMRRRVQLCFQYSSQRSSPKQHMQSYSGDWNGANELVCWILSPVVHHSQAQSHLNSGSGSSACWE